MIFDADTHMSPYKNFPEAPSAQELDERLASAGVDKAICWLLPQGVDNVSESNRYIFDSCRRLPRFVPFGWANIREGLEKALRDTVTCLDEYGFRGVKLNGSQNDYPIDCPEAMQVCEEIAGRGGVIAFHIGYDAPDMTSPFRAAVVAKAFPETTILMIHMGGSSPCDRNNAQSVIDVARLCPNMLLVGSSIGIGDVRMAIEAIGPDRVLFGSDVPFADPTSCIADYRSMLANMSVETQEKVMFGNAHRMLCS